jgi:hypothetical protein
VGDDAVDDAVTAFGVGEAGHGTGAAASVTLLSEPLFDGASALAAVPLVRRDVGRMDVQDLSLSTDRVHSFRLARFAL